MSLEDKFTPYRTAFYDTVANLFKKVAGLFGFPKNPGMPTVYLSPSETTAREQFLDSLPEHPAFWPPIQRPETWLETFLGPTPRPEIIERFAYEDSSEGYYNFYVQHYKNSYFLPDWMSEFFQVRLNIYLDVSVLETWREILFLAFVIYSQLIILRIAMSWFILINPYTFPWYYVTAAVDWSEDILQGVVPAILGVNVTGSVFLGMMGIVADGLNHLILTMPYLPSEGEEIEASINGTMYNVISFRYLPILWYRYPIPNELREYWYRERPDILDFMQRAYHDLDIQFLPDKIVEQLNQEGNLVTQINHSTDHFSTELLPNAFFNNINLIHEHFHYFFLTYIYH